MSDSFTANLTLTKPEVGSSGDTWGTKINANLDAIDALFPSAALALAKGGTGAATATVARTNLGLGTIATQDAATADLKGRFNPIRQALGSGSGTRTVNVASGEYITATATGVATWSFTGFPGSGYGGGCILQLTNGGAYSQSFPGIYWPGGSAPSLTVSGTDVLVFINDGSFTRGVLVMRDSK